MRRETAQRLRIRKHGSIPVPQDISLINPDQRVQHSGICQHIPVLREPVLLRRSVEELCEYFGAERQR